MPSLKSTLFNSDKVTREDLDRAWYGSVLSNMALFRRAGGKTDDLSRTDTPAHLFFKIFFYFDNPSEDGCRFSSNLLSKAFNTDALGYTEFPWSNNRNITTDDSSIPDGMTAEEARGTGYTMDQMVQRARYIAKGGTHSGMSASANTAMNYLLLNNELERAEKLEKFINLLSNISTYSPWYFQEITGLDGALERKEFTEKDFKLEDNRKQITINCLTDAYDNRIGTLLDLYRDVTFSYQLHKEIIPANLRKFDMGIYIFSTPIKNIHGKSANFARFDSGTGTEYLTSYKYIELQNCEIDYNSSKAAYATLDNKDGTAMNYPLIISFDTAMEKRYNEILMREIGDFVEWDIECSMDPTYQKDDKKRYEEFTARLEAYKSKGIVTELVDQSITSAFNQAEGFINHIALGNLHTANIAGLMTNIDRIQSGNVLGGIQGIVQQAGGTSGRNTSPSNSVGKSLHADQKPRTSRAMTWTKKKFDGYK